MEQLRIRFDDQMFDNTVHYGLMEMGDVMFIAKDQATGEKRPAIVIRFTAVHAEGKTDKDAAQEIEGQPTKTMAYKVQAVITARQFLMAAAAMCGKYPDLAKEMGIHVVGPTPSAPRPSAN